jgi:hypothetical protein
MMEAKASKLDEALLSLVPVQPSDVNNIITLLMKTLYPSYKLDGII